MPCGAVPKPVLLRMYKISHALQLPAQCAVLHELLSIAVHTLPCMLHAGDVTFAVVRKLVQPLSQDEAELVGEFAAVHVGMAYNARANVLMAVPHTGRLRALLSGCLP